MRPHGDEDATAPLSPFLDGEVLSPPAGDPGWGPAAGPGPESPFLTEEWVLPSPAEGEASPFAEAEAGEDDPPPTAWEMELDPEPALETEEEAGMETWGEAEEPDDASLAEGEAGLLREVEAGEEPEWEAEGYLFAPGEEGEGLDEADWDESEWDELEEEEEEAGSPPPGVSRLALQARKQWDATDRPKGWQGRVFGLVVHTTGSGLPSSARDRGIYHTVRAVDYYTASHGCHYVNGWRGVEGGDLLQIANEREQAAGVGVTSKDPRKDQRRSVDRGRFESDLPPVLVRLWRARWPGYRHSLELLPGTKTVNSCYVHVECVPCVYHHDGRLVTDAEPLRPGLRFTRAQHDAVARLAVDVAERNGWPQGEAWWRSPRLLGHEDLTPVSRHDRNGGWDPGFLREKPYFDWNHVYEAIERLRGGGVAAGAAAGAAASAAGGGILGSLGDLARRFAELVAGGQEVLAVSLAHQRGERDPGRLANLVFFARHPERGGRPIDPRTERPLAAEWIEIRDRIVRPLLSRLAGGAPAATSPTGGTAGAGAPAGPFGTLLLSAPGRPAFRYAFTPEDVLWTARFMVGEAGGRDDLDNRAVVWAVLNRYALFTNRYYPSFHRFIRAYSTPLQPVLNSAGAARRHMHRPEFVRTGGFYAAPNGDVPRGQLRRHLEIQRTPWASLPVPARHLALEALSGRIANPGIGPASEFASTQVYFKDRHERLPASEAEWRRFTETFAAGKKWRWVGPVAGLNQRKNAFFVQNAVASLPADAVRVLAPGVPVQLAASC